MDRGQGAESESALRALRSAQEEVEALRSGSLSPSAARGYVLRVSNAVDRSLRRLLRDEESVELSLRLKALAPDEIRIDSVLAELRRAERLPMDVAASVHELLETRRRLESDVPADPTDADRAVRVVDQLEHAIRTGNVARYAERPPAFAHPDPEYGGEFDAALPEPGGVRRTRRFRTPPAWAFGAAALVALLAFGAVWFLRDRAPSEMEQGVALFTNGNYEEAAQHFFRYGQANPDDATPHLYLARIHRRMQRFELAVDAIRAAEAISPDDPALHREVGFLLLDTGQPEAAIARFRTAVELDEQSSEGWIGIVRALRESGRAADVQPVIEQAPAEVRALLTSPTPD